MVGIWVAVQLLVYLLVLVLLALSTISISFPLFYQYEDGAFGRAVLGA